MAGLGYKDFTAGAVLTAAQVDGYLMEQAVMNFAGTAARGSALSSVQSAGMMAHVGGGTVTVYDGSDWQQVYPALTTGAGLQFIASASCGTAASVSINDCFTSTYDVYQITITRPFKSGAAASFLARLRVSGTDATTNYNYQSISASSTTVSGGRSTSQNALQVTTFAGDGECAVVMYLWNPAAALVTQYRTSTYYGGTAVPQLIDITGNHSTATAYDGITFFPASNAFAGGTIRVYGYRNA